MSDPTLESTARQSDAIRRRVVVNLSLGADTWEDAAHALEQMALEIRAGGLRGNAVSGGYAYGYSLSASEDEAVTHDSYFQAVNQFLADDRAAPRAWRCTSCRNINAPAAAACFDCGADREPAALPQPDGHP